MNFLSQNIVDALEFAAVAHDGQKRRNPGHIPYICHPAAVGLALAKVGFPEEVIIAGILHDVIEDTPFGAEDIERRFGRRVREMVEGVTEDKRLPWQERNEAYNTHLHSVDENILAISAFDLLANRLSLLAEFAAGRNPWLQFSQQPEAYAKKRLAFDRERIQVFRERLKHECVRELEEVEKKVIEYTEKTIWRE